MNVTAKRNLEAESWGQEHYIAKMSAEISRVAMGRETGSDRAEQRGKKGRGREQSEEAADEELERLARASLRRRQDEGDPHGSRAYYFERVDDDRLARVCSRRLQQRPEHTRALALRASCRAKLNDLEGALSDYGRLLALRPSDEDALYQRGSVHSRMQRLDDAIVDFSAVLSSNPDHAKAAYARGACQNLKGDFHSAIADYNFALARDTTTNSSPAHNSSSLRIFDAAVPAAEALPSDPSISHSGSDPPASNGLSPHHHLHHTGNRPTASVSRANNHPSDGAASASLTKREQQQEQHGKKQQATLRNPSKSRQQQHQQQQQREAVGARAIRFAHHTRPKERDKREKESQSVYKKREGAEERVRAAYAAAKSASSRLGERKRASSQDAEQRRGLDASADAHDKPQRGGGGRHTHEADAASTSTTSTGVSLTAQMNSETGITASQPSQQQAAHSVSVANAEDIPDENKMPHDNSSEQNKVTGRTAPLAEQMDMNVESSHVDHKLQSDSNEYVVQQHSPVARPSAHATSLRERRDSEQPADKGSLHWWEVKNPGKPTKKRTATSSSKRANEKHAAGYKLRKQGRLEEAKEMYMRALELEPSHFKCLFNLGFVNDKLELHEEAIANYDAALRVDKGNSFCWYNRGIANDKLGRHNAAISDFTSAIASDSSNPDAYHNRGFSARKAGRLQDALQDYTEAIRLDPNHCRALYNKAYVLERLHKWEDAVGDYTQALQVDTDNALGYYNRGLARQRCGKLDQARDDLDHALTLSNDDHAGQLFSARGCLKERLGDVEDALADYSAALQREPSSANALRCSAASARARREYTEAIDLFSRLREVEPDDPTPLLGIGFSCRKLGDFQESLNNYSRAAELDEHCTAAWLGSAFALARLGRNLDAADAYSRALDVEQARSVSGKRGTSTTGGLHAMHNRAICKQREGYTESALEDFGRVVQAGPSSIVYFNRGALLERIGRFEEALQDYRKAEQMGKGDDETSGLQDRIEIVERMLIDETRHTSPTENDLRSTLIPVLPPEQHAAA